MTFRWSDRRKQLGYPGLFASLRFIMTFSQERNCKSEDELPPQRKAKSRSLDPRMGSGNLVAAFLKRSLGKPFCSHCLKDLLGFNRVQHVRQITTSFEGDAELRLVFGACSCCGQERNTTVAG